MAEGDAEARKRALDGEELRLSALGSGSDYTPFLQHLGVASLNLGFGGEGHYGQYHSIYDSTDHYVRFMDPGLRLRGHPGPRRWADGAAAGAGRAAAARGSRRSPTPSSRYVEGIETLADELRQETDEHNRMLDLGAFALVAPPDEVRVDPPRKDPVPHLNLAPLRNAGARLQAAAKRYDQVLQETGPSAPAEARHAANAILLKTERALTRDEGLPGRPWFKHFVYAPGFYTGYGVKTLPAVRETIEQREWDRIDERVAATAAVLEAFAAEVEKASAVLSGAAVDQ